MLITHPVNESTLRFVGDRFSDMPSYIDRLLADSQGDALYRDLIVGILLKALEMHRHLIRAWEDKDHSYLAWANRNYWELKYWMDYISESRENGERFRSDLKVDLKDIAEASLKLAILDGADDEFITAIKEQVCKLKAELVQEGLSEKQRYLPVGDDDAEFGGANKIASKYVHATALSVLFRGQDERSLDALFSAAAGVIVHVLRATADLVKKYELPPLPPFIAALHGPAHT